MSTLPVAVALSAIATSLLAPAAPASPPVDGPDGRYCTYAVASDPDPGAPDDAMTGEINAGPMAWDRPFTVHCTIQVDDAAHNGTSNDSTAHVHASSTAAAGGAHVAFLAPTQIGYTSPEDSEDYLCTSVSYGTPETTIYRTPGHSGPDGIPGTGDDVADEWSTDPGRYCNGPTYFYWPDPWETANNLFITVVDPAICAALDDHSNANDPAPGDAVYVDDEGDVFLTDGAPGGISEARWRETMWWDCPPYVDFDDDPWHPGADGADGGEVVDNDTSSPAVARSAVVGYVTIRMNAGDAAPAFSLSGVLAAPNLWQCAATPYLAAQPYAVTCTPVGPPALGWECAVVHTEAATTGAGAARTSVHCNADAVPEAQTATVSGAGARSSTVTPLVPPVVATQFRCTVDNGSGGAPGPGFVALCGDPGAATVEPAGDR